MCLCFLPPCFRLLGLLTSLLPTFFLPIFYCLYRVFFWCAHFVPSLLLLDFPSRIFVQILSGIKSTDFPTHMGFFAVAIHVWKTSFCPLFNLRIFVFVFFFWFVLFPLFAVYFFFFYFFSNCFSLSQPASVFFFGFLGLALSPSSSVEKLHPYFFFLSWIFLLLPQPVPDFCIFVAWLCFCSIFTSLLGLRSSPPIFIFFVLSAFSLVFHLRMH